MLNIMFRAEKFRLSIFILLLFCMPSCVNTTESIKDSELPDSLKRSSNGIWREKLESKFLSGEEAARIMTAIPGYSINCWASEPLMTQPMAFCWDDRGRIWVAENRDYEERGRGFSNSGESRILILEDKDRDGIAETRKVFMEGLAFPAALAVGFDGVFVGAPPNLLFIPDKNHDDKADTNDIKVLLTGWGITDRHETLNSMYWGPDGWLYGLQGFATTSKIKKPKGKGRLYKYKDPFPGDILEGEGIDINGGVWRYHPTKDKFEVFAHGFSNPWGIDYDANGQLFMSACVIPHMWHVVQGGIYQRQGGKHFNPYVYDDIGTIRDHQHSSAHGGARVYQSDAFPENQKGRIFMANIHDHAVLSDILKPQGSGFIASHGDDFIKANDAQFVGFSIEIGPDGGVYVLDWHDGDICGQKVLDSETGRIFRIMPEKSGAKDFQGRYSDLNNLEDKYLIELQGSPSDWHSRRARLILQARAVNGKLNDKTYSQLLSLYETSTNINIKLKALWALHITKGLSESFLLKSLEDTNEYVRSWAIQLSCEDSAASKAEKRKFIWMAEHDPSPVVRLYLASAIQRIDHVSAWKIVSALIKHSEDINDHNITKMIWFGLEPLVGKDPERALKIVANLNIPYIARNVSRRVVDAGAIDNLVKTISMQPNTLLSLLEGMISGIEGSTNLKPPLLWNKVYRNLKQRKDTTSILAEEIMGLFGDTESAQRSLAILKNTQAGLEERNKALRLLTAQQRIELLAFLPILLEDPQMRINAIKSVAAFDEERLGQLLVKKYKTWNESERAEVIQTLSSRPNHGWTLAEALKNNVISKKDIPANTARQLRRVVGSGFVEIWGPIDDKPADPKETARYKALLTELSIRNADKIHGQQLFQKTCGSCHKLGDKGGVIGPDLTGSNRADIDYLLYNILNPSDEVQESYKLVVITTRDGRTYSGNIIREDQRKIIIRVAGQGDVILNKSTIQSKEVTAGSLMPQGLLKSLNDKEVTDLISYIKSAGK